jgi:hypothetical protein
MKQASNIKKSVVRIVRNFDALSQCQVGSEEKRGSCGFSSFSQGRFSEQLSVIFPEGNSMRKQPMTNRLERTFEAVGGRAVRPATIYRGFDAGLVKGRQIEKVYAQAAGRLPEHLFKQVVLEAEALASTTPYPLLFLPALMDEKVSSMERWLKHQREVRERQVIFSTAE